jgi:hypothetical protein
MVPNKGVNMKIDDNFNSILPPVQVLTFIKFPFSGILRNPINLTVFSAVFASLSVTNLAYAQSTETTEPNLLDLLASELVAALVGTLGLGVSALIAWLRKKGIPIATEQEAMFREIVTRRFQKLAKDTWTEMRSNPGKLDEYRKEFSAGRIPDEFSTKLRREGFEFAMELKRNREFRDFARNITEEGMSRLLKDLRTDLKNQYQRRMLEVIPRLVSTAVDSAFDPNVSDPKAWGAKSLENLKPLLLSAEAIDTETNLMIMIRAEINKRVQNALQQ